MKYRWKFLRLQNNKIRSEHRNCVWKIGEWKHKNKLDMCRSGFHCSKKIYEAFSYIQGEILAKVEVYGKVILKEKKITKKMTINEVRVFECEIDGKEAFGGVLISS